MHHLIEKSEFDYKQIVYVTRKPDANEFNPEWWRGEMDSCIGKSFEVECKEKHGEVEGYRLATHNKCNCSTDYFFPMCVLSTELESDPEIQFENKNKNMKYIKTFIKTFEAKKKPSVVTVEYDGDEYIVEYEFLPGEKGSWDNPTIPDDIEIIRILLDNNDVTTELSKDDQEYIYEIALENVLDYQEDKKYFKGESALFGKKCRT